MTAALYPFKAFRRNSGHWDFLTEEGRIRLRGGPGDWAVSDERPGRDVAWRYFRSQASAVAFITSELMWEPLTVEGQVPHVMESWNVRREAAQ